MGLSIICFKGSQIDFPNKYVQMYSADPDNLQLDAAFQLGLHCLPN